MTLEQYLQKFAAQNIIDHALRVSVDEDGCVSFYIHPLNANGDTLDFEVEGNQLTPIETVEAEVVKAAS